MKKIDFWKYLLVAAVLAFIGCENALLPKPGYYSRYGNSSKSEVPEELAATQGLRREITLSWMPVVGAVRYNIYRADSPSGNFEMISETSENTGLYTIAQPAGTDAYYRVAAVFYGNKVKEMSLAVRGTTLAQPNITDIESVKGNADSDIHVYWYMGNEDAYKENVRYTVYAYKAGQSQPAATKISDTNNVLFENLDQHTNYEFQIEAYNLADQDAVEKSEKKDAATARRTRPNPVEDLTVSQGDFTDKVIVKFKLPELVYVDHGSDDAHDYYEHDMYFKIFKRKVGNQDWITVTDYFGKNKDGYTDKSKNKNLTSFASGSYVVGDFVEYTENFTGTADRGVQYEYKVQSYIDTAIETVPRGTESAKLNTTNNEKAVVNGTGWLVAVPDFYTKDHSVETNEEKTEVTKVQVGFGFEFDTLGLADKYNYLLQEKKADIPATTTSQSQLNFKDNGEPKVFKTIDGVNSYLRSWTEVTAERGYYSYSLYVVKADETATANAICHADAHGKIMVDTKVGEKPVLEMFSLKSGYADKFEIKWKYNDDYEYTLYYKAAGDTAYTAINEGNDHEFRLALENKNTGDEITFTHKNAPSGITRTYYLSASSGVYHTDSPTLTGKTLSKPAVFQSGYDYDKIPIKWKDNDDADKFKISIERVGNNIEKIKADFEKGEDGNFGYTLKGDKDTAKTEISNTYYTDATDSGKDLTLNIYSVGHTTQQQFAHAKDDQHPGGIEGLKVTDKGYTKTENNDETTAETEIKVRTLGPALTNVAASVAQKTDAITVTWKKLEGAQAYAVVRNGWKTPQNKTTGDADKPDNVIYTVSSENGIIKVSSTDTNFDESKVSVVDNGDTFTLTDTAYTGNINQQSAWQKSQGRIKWGVPNDYFVLPLKEAGDAVDYNFEENANIVKIGDNSLELKNIDKVRKTGSALGYGWNVTATKGVEKKVSNDKATAVNDAANETITISWDNPYISANNIRYSVYRTEEKKNDWKALNRNVAYKVYSDTTAVPGVVYEYLVGVNANNNSSDPTTDSYYKTTESDERKDTKWQDEKLAAGFVMPTAPVSSVTKDKRYHPTEKQDIGNMPAPAMDVEWSAVTIGGKANRMIDGYVLEVYNSNLDNQWHEVGKVKFGENNTLKPTTGQKNMNRSANSFVTSVSSSKSETAIKPVRDNHYRGGNTYKLWYRVRPFTENDEDSTRTLGNKANYEFASGIWMPDIEGETEFIKWGTRRLSEKEFIWCATHAIDGAVFKAANGWQTQYLGGWKIKDYGSGYVVSKSSFGVGLWAFYIIYANVENSFLKVDGRIGADTPGAGRWPNFYFTNMGGKDAFLSDYSVVYPDYSGGVISWSNYNRLSGIAPANTYLKDGYNRIKIEASDSAKNELGGAVASSLFDGWIGFTNLHKNASGSISVWYEWSLRNNDQRGQYTANGSQNILNDWTALRHD